MGKIDADTLEALERVCPLHTSVHFVTSPPTLRQLTPRSLLQRQKLELGTQRLQVDLAKLTLLLFRLLLLFGTLLRRLLRQRATCCQTDPNAAREWWQRRAVCIPLGGCHGAECSGGRSGETVDASAACEVQRWSRLWLRCDPAVCDVMSCVTCSCDAVVYWCGAMRAEHGESCAAVCVLRSPCTHLVCDTRIISVPLTQERPPEALTQSRKAF